MTWTSTYPESPEAVLRILLVFVPSRRWLICVQDSEYSLRALGVRAFLHYKISFIPCLRLFYFAPFAPLSMSAARNSRKWSSFLSSSCQWMH